MICIIRLQSQEQITELWEEVLSRQGELQETLGNAGRLLYLTKRHNSNDVSLFVHIIDGNVLGDFIAEHLSKLPGVDSLWLINMLKPIFFPLPQDSFRLKRFSITVKVFPPRLADVYGQIAELKLPETMKLAYLAYTCHLFGDCLQFSLLVEPDGETLRKYVGQVIDRMPGVLRTTVCEIDKTHPFISYEEWQSYTAQNPVLIGWDEQNMIAQFQNHG